MTDTSVYNIFALVVLSDISTVTWTFTEQSILRQKNLNVIFYTLKNSPKLLPKEV
jgi:hypothetical protein